MGGVSGSMGSHVARRARMDALFTGSCHGTPRSSSWTRPTERSLSARPERSRSVTRSKSKADEEEKREVANAAFQEWLKRKAAEPRGPRASPTREQISLHLKEDAKHRVYNKWLNSKRFVKSPQKNGTISPNDSTNASSI